LYSFPSQHNSRPRPPIRRAKRLKTAKVKAIVRMVLLLPRLYHPSLWRRCYAIGSRSDVKQFTLRAEFFRSSFSSPSYCLLSNGLRESAAFGSIHSVLTSGFGPEGRMLRRTMHIRFLAHRVGSPPSIEALPKRLIRPRFWLPRTKRDSSNGRLSNVCRERSGHYSALTFAALMIGVQRAISLFTRAASGSSWIADDDVHWPRRLCLRPRYA